MIAAVVGNTDTVLRSEVESHFRESLESIGYNAVSSLNEFGISGLRNLDQENSYKTLCDKGIDAVMTLALIDRSSENYSEPKSAYTQPVKYYYERIWQYKQRQDQFNDINIDSSKKYSWEMILFDLTTLQPHYIIQSRVYENGVLQSINKQFWNDIIKRLTKDKFLKRKAPVTAAPKSF